MQARTATRATSDPPLARPKPVQRPRGCSNLRQRQRRSLGPVASSLPRMRESMVVLPRRCRWPWTPAFAGVKMRWACAACGPTTIRRRAAPSRGSDPGQRLSLGPVASSLPRKRESMVDLPRRSRWLWTPAFAGVTKRWACAACGPTAIQRQAAPSRGSDPGQRLSLGSVASSLPRMRESMVVLPRRCRWPWTPAFAGVTMRWACAACGPTTIRRRTTPSRGSDPGQRLSLGPVASSLPRMRESMVALPRRCRWPWTPAFAGVKMRWACAACGPTTIRRRAAPRQVCPLGGQRPASAAERGGPCPHGGHPHPP